MNEPRFEGKNVVLTGASSGIGQSTAVRFVAEGANVFGLARSKDGLEETREKVADTDRFTYHQTDLSDDSSTLAGAKAAIEHFGGKVDILCNIAGITEPTPIENFDFETAHRALQINFLSPMRLISEIVPTMPTGADSVIINISSAAATQAMPTLTAYGGSKAALVTASFSLAIELASKRIRVVPISPSGVQTKMMWDIWEAVKDYEGDWYSRLIHPWGQEESGSADDLASFIAFAASKEAAYWNGTDLRIDGGARASY